MRVLQLEDDAAAARCNAMALRSIGAVVDSVETCEEALEILRFGDYDILIVDLQIPDMPGHEFIRMLRARGIHTPIAVLTGHCGMAAKMAAFESGIDDFIAKPVAIAELIARIRAIIRRNCGFSQNVLREGELLLDQDTRQVTVAGRGLKLKLSRKEYALLELLMLRRGQVVSNSRVMDHLYGGPEEPHSRTVAVFLCHLRKKLAQAGITDIITTVAGVGLMIPRCADNAPAAMPLDHVMALDGNEARYAAGRRQLAS
jgi:two-component system cell cycle response regulator CtrA